MFNVTLGTLVGGVLPFYRDTVDVLYSPSRVGWVSFMVQIDMIKNYSYSIGILNTILLWIIYIYNSYLKL